jgi:hypothetical protein
MSPAFVFAPMMLRVLGGYAGGLRFPRFFVSRLCFIGGNDRQCQQPFQGYRTLHRMEVAVVLVGAQVAFLEVIFDLVVVVAHFSISQSLADGPLAAIKVRGIKKSTDWRWIQLNDFISIRGLSDKKYDFAFSIRLFFCINDTSTEIIGQAPSLLAFSINYFLSIRKKIIFCYNG